MSALDEPLISGPRTPALLGSALWQAMQVVMYTCFPFAAFPAAMAGVPPAKASTAATIVNIVNLIAISSAYKMSEKKIGFNSVVRKSRALSHTKIFLSVKFAHKALRCATHFPSPRAGRSLGHKSIQAAAIYAQLLTDPVRDSLEGAVNTMLTHGGVNKPAEVIKMPKRRRTRSP